MRLREAQRAVFGDVDLLTPWNGLVEAGAGLGVQRAGLQDRGGVLEAGAVEPGDAAGAVGGGLFADVEGAAVGVDLAVVDGGGGADGH